jgi:ATP-dependent RNA helicase RhlE
VETEKKLPLLNTMLANHPGLFLVFARTKHGADRLAKRLSIAGVKAAAIHGNRTQSQRNQALKGFQSGYYRVLVATDVASRGIHVDGIAHVVNFDLPQAPEDFIHRVGRAGRAGARGTASLFGTRSERGEVLRIEKALRVKLLRQPVDPSLLLSLPDGETDRAPHRSAGRGHQTQGNRGVRGKGQQRNARGERRPHEQPLWMGGARADARV